VDTTYLIELVRDVTPLWDQRDKNFHNRDLKSKLWDEIGEKLNVTGKYWNNNTYEIVRKFFRGRKKPTKTHGILKYCKFMS